jgi:hypothetical protein
MLGGIGLLVLDHNQSINQLVLTQKRFSTHSAVSQGSLEILFIMQLLKLLAKFALQMDGVKQYYNWHIDGVP